ncbi:hypothetical protein KN10_1470 [Anoxybacillus flavithermus NBRC 109594]|uniref:Uncharacterized protein n=1 Tax=Anoxybacillus flavithermus NBRC 109594 TaxID=1315967 RepID=R4G0V7_9BACL|nr:hypothetical protein KN10_1470 [Anoxybacillus flavithermus NBRC 109594]
MEHVRNYRVYSPARFVKRIGEYITKCKHFLCIFIQPF